MSGEGRTSRSARPWTAPRGFTLVELLVVVTLMVVLIAVLLPALSVARRTANTTMGLAHQREIGHAIMTYTFSWQDMLPPGYYFEAGSSKNTDWAIVLEGMLTDTGQTRATFGFETGRKLSKIYTDPNAAVDGGRTHYSTHPVLMPDLSPTRPTQKTYRFGRLTRTSRLVLLADGVQDPLAQHNSHATLFQLDAYGVWIDPVVGPPHFYRVAEADNVEPIDPGENLDVSAEAGQIRWRQWDDTAANILFADAHAATTLPEDVRKADIRPNR